MNFYSYFSEKILFYTDNLPIILLMPEEKNIRKPNQARSRETKEKIMQAAGELFAELGYYKTNTKLIAKRAGVPVGSVYAYFSDKKGILLESIQAGHEKITHNMMEHESDPAWKEDPEYFIRSVIESNIEIHKLLPAFHRDMKFLRNTEPDIKNSFEISERNSYEQTKEILKSAEDLFNIEDIEATAIIVHRIIEDFTHYLTYDEPEIGKERVIKQLTAMLTSYLAG